MELIRGTPLLVQIFIVYFFIGTVLNLDRFTAGVAALAVFTGASRGGNRARRQSIYRGRWKRAEAWYDLGPDHALRHPAPGLQTGAAYRSRVSSSTSSRTPLWSPSSPSRISPRRGAKWSAPPSARSEVWFTVALLYLVRPALSFLVRRLR